MKRKKKENNDFKIVKQCLLITWNIIFLFLQDAFKTNWINWFSDSLMTPQSICFSTQNDLLLIGTCSGILSVIPTKLLINESSVQHSSKKVRVVKAKDEAEIGRRAMPVSISWWATNESKALAIVGTNHGLVIIIDLVDGKEVSYWNMYLCCKSRQLYSYFLQCSTMFQNGKIVNTYK